MHSSWELATNRYNLGYSVGAPIIHTGLFHGLGDPPLPMMLGKTNRGFLDAHFEQMMPSIIGRGGFLHHHQGHMADTGGIFPFKYRDFDTLYTRHDSTRI